MEIGLAWRLPACLAVRPSAVMHLHLNLVPGPTDRPSISACWLKLPSSLLPPSLARPPARPTRASKQQSPHARFSTWAPLLSLMFGVGKLGHPDWIYQSCLFCQSLSPFVLSGFSEDLSDPRSVGRTLSAFLPRREECGFAAIPLARLSPRPSAHSALPCREIRRENPRGRFVKSRPLNWVERS